MVPTAVTAGFLRTILAGIICLSASIHFHPWTLRPGSTSLAGLQIGNAPLTSRFGSAPGDAEPLVHADAAALYAALRRESSTSVVLIDENRIMPGADPVGTWTGMNNAANFLPLPREAIRHYVRQGAKVFRRPGWLIADKADAAFALDAFDAGYTIAERRTRGDYTAYRLIPRN